LFHSYTSGSSNYLGLYYRGLFKRPGVWCLWLFPILFCLGCNNSGIVIEKNNSNEIFLDQRFTEFYNWLGGENILGPVISPKITHGEIEYQYTAATLLVFNPEANAGRQYQLAPIGLEIGVAQPPTTPESPLDHEIFSEFLDFYIQLGGAQVAGRPITPVQYNAQVGRIEQYFENLGIYRLENDQEIKLIHIGTWMCGDHCSYAAPRESQVYAQTFADSPFSEAINRLDPSFTGNPLTEPYTAANGQIQQIFENVVIFADPNYPAGIRLRPILKELGVQAEPNNIEVSEYFQDYINRNSGLEFSGKPITEFTKLSDELCRQCFENLCLDYKENLPEELRIQPAPLGYSYKIKVDK
jgi:hypothetical protein